MSHNNPNWGLNYDPPPAEWNLWWSNKQDWNAILDQLIAQGGSVAISGGSIAGTVTFTGGGTAVIINNNATVGGTLGVTGAVTFSGTAAITSNATVGGTLGVTGNTTLNSALSVAGAATLAGNLSVAGVLSGVGVSNYLATYLASPGAIGGTSASTGKFTTVTATSLSLTTNSASSQKQVAGPTAPSSTSVYAMQGLAGSITPATTGSVMITIAGSVQNLSGAADVGIAFQISYGTGSAPSNAASLTGTQVGAVQEWTAPTIATTETPFSITVVVTGLAASTAYWIDLAAKSLVTGSDVSLVGLSISAIEFR